MAVFVNVPDKLLSWIPEDDPFKIIRTYQIKYWWDSFSDLYDRYDPKLLKKIVRILSKKKCWKKVDDLHGVKLDVKVVGKKLIAETSSYSFALRFKIACRYCLKNNIVDFINEKKRMSFESLCCIVAESIKGKILSNDSLVNFWLHFLERRMNRLIRDDLHVFEYGFRCAVEMKQLRAMKFFWRKIKYLPENEISNQRKEDIIMYYAVQTANTCYTRPEIFDFIFSQIYSGNYPELLERDLQNNNSYTCLSTLLNALRFSEFKELFDCLGPDEISVHSYCSWIQLLRMDTLSGRYMDAAVCVFIHMWEKSGFDEHRSAVYNELAVNAVLQGSLVIPLLTKGYAELVWAILDAASPESIERYMHSRNALCVRILLSERDDFISLHKFWSYQPTVQLE